MALTYIKEDPSIIGLLDLRENSKIKGKLDAIKDSIKADLAGIIQTASENHDNGINVEDNAFIANRIFVLYKNIDPVFSKVLKNIKNLGFNPDAVGDVDTDITDPENEESDTYIYGRSQHEKSPLDSARGIVSLYLSTKNKTTLNSKGEVVDVIDTVGLKVPLNLNETYAEVFKTLANIRTIEGMIAKLKEVGRTNPLMASIASDLGNNLMESSTPLMHKGQRVLNFRTAFFNTFRKSYSDFTTVMTRMREDRDTGEPYLTSQVIKSNSNRQENKIKKQWILNSRNNAGATLEKKRAEWTRSVVPIFSAYKRAELVGLLNDVTNMEILKPVQAMLSSMGIETSITTLQEIRLRDKDRNQSFFNRVLGTPSPIQKGISYEALANKFWVAGEDIFAAESSTISSLAISQSHNVTEVALQAFLNEMGNLVYPLNLPTSTTDLFDELSNNEGRYAEFLTDPMMGKTRIVRLMYDNAEQGTVKLSKLSAYKTAEAKQGVEFSDMSPLSNISMRLIAYANPDVKGRINEKTGELLFPTPSDKGNSSTIILPKLSDISVISGVLIGDYKSNQSFKKWLLESAEMEFDRIKRAYAKYAEVNGDTSKLLKDYHYNSKGVGAAMSFNYYPELNKFLKVTNGVVEDVDFKSPEVIKALSDSVVAALNADVAYLVQKGVLEKGSTLETMTFTQEANQLLPVSIQDPKIVLQFLANTIAVNHETSLLFTGDLAFFPIGSEQYNKANKRTGLAETPGEKLMIGEGGSNPTYQVAFMNVPGVKSKGAEDINKFLGVEKSAYDGIDVTDGQGFCTLDRYVDLLKGRGMLTEEILETVEELKKRPEDIEWMKVNARLETTKGFVHTSRYDPNFNMIVPQNLKYSVMPIFPAMFAGNATMEALYAKMLKDEVDELNFTSTAKIGAYNINKMEDETLKKVTFHNEDYRIPQVVAYKSTIEQNAGSQIRKSITGNLEMEGNYSPRYSIEAGKGAISGQQLEDNYQKAMRLNIEEDYSSVMDSFSTKGVVDPLKIADRIIRTLDDTTSSSTPSHIAESLSTIILRDGTKTTLLPLSFPAIKTKVESTLFSIISKKVTKKKMPGFVGVQYTSLGWDIPKEGIETDNTLRWTREENGVIHPAEIRCSPVYFLEALKQMEPTPQIIEAIKQLHNGTFNPENLKNGLNEIVIYRIPYQGLSSSVPCRVKSFTPEAAGVTITVPMEMISQAGIDFDIDKVYVEIKHFTTIGDELHAVESEMTTRQGRDNMIIDTHYTVLTDVKHYAEMSTPNNTDTLSELKAKYLNLYGNVGFGKSWWGSLAVQESLRNEGKDGGVFIGISADAATFHSIWDKIGAVQLSRFHLFGGSIVINGKFRGAIHLGNKYNDAGNLISNEYGEVMNVSVDNAKDPILGNLNINTVTGPAYLWLVEAGAGLRYATALINTPIVRELAENARNLEQLYGKEGSFAAALNTVAEKYKLSNEVTKFSELIGKRDFDITMESLLALEQNVLQGKQDLSRNQEALLAFLSFQRYGNDLNSAKTALKIDVGGAKQSIAENLLVKQKLATIRGTYSSMLEDNPLNVKTNGTVTVNPERFAAHSLGHYEKYGILGAIDLVSQVVHDNSATFNDMTKEVSSKVPRLDGKDLRLMFNDYYTSLITSQGMFSEKNIVQIDLAKPNFVKQLLGGELSLGSQTLALQKIERAKMEAKQSYRPNKFLMSLTVEKNKDGLGIDIVSFDNSVIKAMSTDQKNDLAAEFERLFNSENDAEYEFGYGAVLYMLSTEGFGRGINSYAELLPGNIFTNIYGSDGVSVVDYFRSIESQLKSPEKTPEYEVYNHNFAVNLLRNRATQMSGVKSLNNKSVKAKKGIMMGLGFEEAYIDGTTIMHKVGTREDGSPVVESVTELNQNKTVAGQYIQGVDTTLGQDEISKVKQSGQAGDSITNGQCL